MSKLLVYMCIGIYVYRYVCMCINVYMCMYITLEHGCVTSRLCLRLYFEPLMLIVYLYKDNLKLISLCFIYIFIYVYKQIGRIFFIFYIIILEWMFYLGAPLSIYFGLLSKLVIQPCAIFFKNKDFSRKCSWYWLSFTVTLYHIN